MLFNFATHSQDHTYPRSMLTLKSCTEFATSLSQQELHITFTPEYIVAMFVSASYGFLRQTDRAMPVKYFGNQQRLSDIRKLFEATKAGRKLVYYE